jgi:hypothetical protein
LTAKRVALQVLKGADQKVLWASGTKCSDELTPQDLEEAGLAVQGPPPQPEPQPLFYILRNILQSASYMAVRSLPHNPKTNYPEDLTTSTLHG